MRAVFANRDARIYLIGQVFSLFGDTALWLAMAVWVKTLTGSSSAAGLTFFFFNAASLLAPVSGLLVDRFRRRPILILTNAFTGASVLLLLIVRTSGQIWLVYLVMALYGLAYSVLSSAQSALLTVIVPDELLADANGALSTVRESLRLVGPLSGAGLFVLIGPHAVAILDSATFAVPIISLLMLHVVEPDPTPQTSHWRREIMAGARYIARTVVLRQLVIAAACAFSVFGFTETVIFAVNANGLHRPPSFVGVLIAFQGIGAVVGGPTAAPVIRRIGEGRIVGVALLLSAAAALLLMAPSLAVVVGGVIVFGVSIPWLVVGFTTLLQRRTPAELQGRVYSAADTLVAGPQTISIALGAALLGVVGYRWLLGAMSLVIAAAAVYLLSRPEQRMVVDVPPLVEA